MKELTVNFSYDLYNRLRRAAEEESIRQEEIVRKGIMLWGLRYSYSKEYKILAVADVLQPQVYEVLDAAYGEDESFDFNKLVIRLADDIYDGLRRIADEGGIAPADVVRKGLHLYLDVRQRQKEGKNLVILEVAILEISGIAQHLGKSEDTSHRG